MSASVKGEFSVVGAGAREKRVLNLRPDQIENAADWGLRRQVHVQLARLRLRRVGRERIRGSRAVAGADHGRLALARSDLAIGDDEIDPFLIEAGGPHIFDELVQVVGVEIDLGVAFGRDVPFDAVDRQIGRPAAKGVGLARSAFGVFPRLARGDRAAGCG